MAAVPATGERKTPGSPAGLAAEQAKYIRECGTAVAPQQLLRLPVHCLGAPSVVDMLPSLSLQRHHYRRIGFFAILIIIFRHRLSVFLTLLYTYVAFTFLPHAVLGEGDGWDLENLIPPDDAPEIVPRIIHQARLGDLEMKEKWIVANASCAELHPGPEWRFELWDTERANAFVAENYPDLLDTYLGYEQGAVVLLSPPIRISNRLRPAVEIQRSNVIRYLILYEFGGIYLDLDIKCLKPMDFFLTVDWISSPGLPVGINNAFMAVTPGHPFLKHAIKNIKRFDLNWISLYVTDM